MKYNLANKYFTETTNPCWSRKTKF